MTSGKVAGATPALQRRALGWWSIAMGLAHVLPVAFIALSAAGPSSHAFSPRTMSLYYYAHFISLTAVGIVGLAAWSAKDQVFHGGPFIDFSLVLTGFFLTASFTGWLAGPFLILAGVRLLKGRPFLNPAHATV